MKYLVVDVKCFCDVRSTEAFMVRTAPIPAYANAQVGKTLGVANEPNPLPDDSEDLRTEILHSLGQDWLYSENIWLNNRAPNEVIGTSDENQVRDLLRSILVAALS